MTPQHQMTTTNIKTVNINFEYYEKYLQYTQFYEFHCLFRW